jgi:hypothetical protein
LGEEEEETVPPQNDTVSSLSFLKKKPHETASFCLKRAVSFK